MRSDELGPPARDGLPINVKIVVDPTRTVSGLLQVSRRATACYVMAHAAGAGMAHPFMTLVADGLAKRQIGTLRYQFPYMEAGMRRPDHPSIAHATVRAAVAAAANWAPSLPLYAGGKSFGGRMTSQAQAAAPLPHVRGIVFFGFPLHAANKPSNERAAHLAGVQAPMLFLQGTRDALADMRLLAPVVASLPSAALIQLDQADHSFRVPARSGRTNAQVLAEALDTLATWLASH